jgi:hypothetical protein
MAKDMEDGRNIVDIEGEIHAETEKAWLVFDGSIEEWVPKSQCDYNKDEKTFSMPEWLAKDKGFI